MDDMRAIDRVEDEVLRSFEKLSMLTVVGASGAMIAKGLSAAMARAALSALILVMRGDLPLKNFGTVAEAMAWFRGAAGAGAAADAGRG